MARYIIEGDGFVRINETYGTIENLSDFEAQVYTSPTADEGIVLYPRARLSFKQPIYVARASGEAGTPVVATLPFTCCGDGSGDSSDDNDPINIALSNCGCGCSSSDTAMVPCGCHSEVTITPTTTSGCTCNQTVELPSEYCNCNTGGYSYSGGGNLKLQVPLVVNINMPQTFNMPSTSSTNCGCCGGTSSLSTSEQEKVETYDDFQSLADEYFNSKNLDGTYTMPSTNTDDSYDFKAEADKYFNEKE